MTKLHVSPEVQKDLQGIKEYIALELENPTAALKIISNITGWDPRLGTQSANLITF